MSAIRQPTSDQCSANEAVEPIEYPASRAFAAWHPQWGGYAGRCVVEHYVHERPDACFEVHNFHDGEFPLKDDDMRPPLSLHYCSALQIVEFGVLIAEKLTEAARETDPEASIDPDRVRGLIERLKKLLP